jgi:hypothetical protein
VEITDGYRVSAGPNSSAMARPIPRLAPVTRTGRAARPTLVAVMALAEARSLFEAVSAAAGEAGFEEKALSAAVTSPTVARARKTDVPNWFRPSTDNTKVLWLRLGDRLGDMGLVCVGI